MIIDAHAHFINREIIKNRVKDPEFLKTFQNPSIEEGRKMWLEAMDKNGIEKTVFIALDAGNEDFLKFIESSDRFIGTTNVNPIEEDAVKKLEADIKRGCKGLKLFATSSGFDVGDERAYSVYEYCEKNEIPIVIHFGVTIGRTSDLDLGNPLRLSKVVSRFPKLKFIIAHFGAGFFKEALLLMYKNENVYFDTSGTNNWLEYSPFGWTLKDLFRISLNAIGSKRILFGTDSHRMSEGYRENILKEQMEIVKELAGEEGVEDIFYNNAKKVFGI
ncbi:MAG: amidohydrolase [Nanoarchaeota archaeon]|nr:amidohydrolase [Nanoarchaeota archaeon]